MVHDLLAYVAERMIEMHEKRQEQVEGFWLDLEGDTDAKAFEDLKGHGKWESSLWKAEICCPFVDEESRSTRRLCESLGGTRTSFKAFVKVVAGSVSNLSKVIAVCREHHLAYRQLMGRIGATDWLIEQML